MTNSDETATKAATENLPDKTAQKNLSKNSVSPAPAKPIVVKSAKRMVASGADTDEVRASALDINTKARKSLSVHHLQARLADLGYPDAAASLDGRYDALTLSALAAWQEDNDFPVGPLTHEQITRVFAGDPNVTVVLDTPEL